MPENRAHHRPSALSPSSHAAHCHHPSAFTGALLVVLLVATLTPLTTAAHAAPPGDESTRLLEVRRQQVELRSARSHLARTQELADQGLISAAELERARVQVENAQLSYQEAVLGFLSVQPRVTVEKAVKWQRDDGRKAVTLQVTNETPRFDESQLELLDNFDGSQPLPEELRHRKLHDIFLSLQEVPGGPGEGTTIALPYEVRIAELPHGVSKTLNFQLLRDVQAVRVAVAYRGSVRHVNVQLQQARTENVVDLGSTQISQEADLGAQATFDLKIERSGVDQRSYRLAALNLPPEVSYHFLDPRSQARLSQIHFPAGVTEQNLQLKLFIPERAGGGVEIDRRLDFWAVVMDPDEADTFTGGGPYTAEQIEDSRAGSLRLAVTPRGVGRIEVSAPSLYSELEQGETAENVLTVKNTGTRRLDNVQIDTETPLHWQVDLEPANIQDLGPGDEREVRVRVTPPTDVPVGDYEVRIETESFADNRPVPTEDKVYRLSVQSGGNLWASLGLLGTVAALGLGVVVYGTRLAKK